MRTTLAVLVLLLAGCTTFRHPPRVDPIDQQEQMLARVQETARQAVLDASKEVGAAQTKVLQEKDHQLQAAANSNAGAQIAAAGITGRVGEVVRNKLEETAAVLPEARLTPAQVAALLVQLDELKTSAADLEKQHQAALIEAARVRNEARMAEEKLAATQVALDTIKETAAKQIQQATQQLAETAKKEAVLARDAEAEAKDRAALNTKLLYLFCGTGILLLLGGGAAFLPQLGGPHPTISAVAVVLGVTLIGLGYYLPQLPLWVPIVFGVFVCIGVPLGMYWAFRRGLFTEPPEQIGDIKLAK